MEIFRNILRRKLRSTLTLFGIAIGIFALTVMGSMAEKMNLLMDGGVTYVTGQISISPKGNGGMFSQSGGVLKYKAVAQIEKIKGVKNVAKEISFMLDDSGASQMSVGMPEIVTGFDEDTKFKNRNWSTLDFEDGRLIKKGDRKVANIGIDIAKTKKLKTGDYITIRKKKFKIIGVFAKTLTGPDKMVFISLAEAQALYVNSNPLLKSLKTESKKALKINKQTLQFMDPKIKKRIDEARKFKQNEILTGASVEWEDGYDPEKLAKTIEKKVKDVDTISPAQGRKSFEQASLVINAVTMGSTVIALIVGALAVLNTMFMSVNERVREIGLKQAIGAKTKHIMKEILTEAIVVSLIGGLLGFAAGFIAVTAVNAYTANTGIEIFQLTNRLIMASLVFAVVLGLAGGFYPALRAARLQPVKALREDK